MTNFLATSDMLTATDAIVEAEDVLAVIAFFAVAAAPVLAVIWLSGSTLGRQVDTSTDEERPSLDEIYRRIENSKTYRARYLRDLLRRPQWP